MQEFIWIYLVQKLHQVKLSSLEEIKIFLKETSFLILYKFNKYRVDTFIVDSFDLGPLKKISLRHDNSNLGSSWYVDKVTFNFKKILIN